MKQLKARNALALLAVLIFLSQMVLAGETNGLIAAPGFNEEELAARYAPVLYFAEGEKVFPVNVEYFLEHSALKKAQGKETVLRPPIDASALANYSTPDYYLDDTLGGINDSGITDDYKKKEKLLGYTVYARVKRDYFGGKNQYVVQYWFFYVFNEGKVNLHEGDWEMIQVELGADKEPLAVSYSQHLNGERSSWDNVSKDGTHPLVFVALGSHANYLRPYEGKVGLASDTVGENGKILKPSDYSLVLLEENNPGKHAASMAWLDFGGYWGEFAGEESNILGESGPKGPVFNRQGLLWNNPLAWSQGLFKADFSWFSLNWVVYNFSLLFLLLVSVICVVRVFLIVRRHKKQGLGPRLVSLFYIDGANLKSAGNILMIASLALGLAGLFLPWYYVNANVRIGGVDTKGEINLFYVDGVRGVQVNLFTGKGVTQMFGLGLPFSIILAVGFFMFLLSLVGVEKSSAAGKKYILRGARTCLPVVVILLVMANIGLVVSLISPMLSGQLHEELISNSTSIFNKIASSPVLGELSAPLPTGTLSPEGLKVSWGLGLGAYALIVSAILAIAAGVMEFLAREEFFHRE